MSAGIVRVLEIGLFPVLWITKRLLAIPALWWKRIGLAIVSASFGVVVWARFHWAPGTLGERHWAAPGDVAFFSGYVWVFVVYMCGLLVLDKVVVAGVRRVARLLPMAGSGALAVARHTLDSRRAASRRDFWNSKTELGGLALMAVILSAFVAGFTIDRAQASQVDALTFDAVVVPLGVAQSNPAPAIGVGVGVHRVPLNPMAFAALEADPSLAVVPYGQVTVGPVDAPQPTASITIVSPGALEKVTPDGARPLGLQEGFLLSPDIDEGTLRFPAPQRVIDVSTGVGTATLFHRPWFNASALATRGWAESVWGDVPVVGALVKYVGDDVPATGQFEYIADAAARAGAVAQPAPELSPKDVAYFRGANDFSRGTLGVMSIYVAIAASIGVVVFSVRTVRTHRQVRATVAALGATPRALAAAVPIDAGIALAVAFAMGLPLGAVVAAMAKHPTLLVYGAPLDPDETAWGLWWNVTHIGWGQVAGIAAATWVLAVAAATVYGFLVARRTPVDELREAIKEGAV
ncbi:MAG: hypothetical protein HGA51_02205 [Demequinaceae bacterium]|nr:hypothetical protein [Demequinaceae bacterium]